jgi:hypothetical protein
MTDPIELKEASILVPEAEDQAEFVPAKVLQEEVEKRTGVRWPISSEFPTRGPVVVIAMRGATVGSVDMPSRKGKQLPEDKPEGYRLVAEEVSEGRTIVWVIGADRRGTLFGVGRLLRTLSLAHGSAQLEGDLDVATSPAYTIRGHQLAYRDTANSYEAWSGEQYDQYIRELAIFGSNCVENIPFQDKPDTVLMKIPRSEMNVRISEICAKYDMAHWVWIPAVVDLADEGKQKAEIEKNAALFRDCPRIDALFFPGGDPGSNHPKLIMPHLAELAKHLKVHHPKAGIWISLQQFSREWVDYFFDYLDEHDPDWLSGVVHGPSSPPAGMTRERLPEKYRIRHYPDITHNVRCQYPVEWWDQAFALTLGREAPNPRPNFFAQVHNKIAPHTDGFLSYSDGCHDDVNKVLWNVLAWDPDTAVEEILIEYCRFFFGAEVAQDAARGIFALEENWVGVLADSERVDATERLWKELEGRCPHLEDNWRWLLCLLRARYDAYTKRRLVHEQGLEAEAMGILGEVAQRGVEDAMDAALEMVRRADTPPILKDSAKRIEEICESLFHLIGLQTSVPKYHASGYERGCVLDFLNHPLNNRWWLEDEFSKIREMTDEREKMERIEIIRTWENPGPGSFYDDVGNISKMPNVQRGWYPSPGHAWWDSGFSRTRLSSQVYMSLPKLTYENLDPEASYTARVAGFQEALLEVNGERIPPTVYEKGEGQSKVFPIPRRLTKEGSLEITFARPDEQHLNWRHRSRISDVWLLKG